MKYFQKFSPECPFKIIHLDDQASTYLSNKMPQYGSKKNVTSRHLYLTSTPYKKVKILFGEKRNRRLNFDCKQVTDRSRIQRFCSGEE